MLGCKIAKQLILNIDTFYGLIIVIINLWNRGKFLVSIVLLVN